MSESTSESFGTWQLDSVLAVGGLGEIWRAHRGAEVVALKRLHSHLVRNVDVRTQFALEQRLTTELPRHPNVVHAVEAAEVPAAGAPRPSLPRATPSLTSRPYIALEIAPGEDLRRQLVPPRRAQGAGEPEPRTSPPISVVLPRARVLAIAIAACDAAEHIHHHGFVHGDINPGNLMVSTSDHVTLIDLGIARELGRAGTVRGTHAYMAPEQVRAEPWTAATDVFALGVVLWELVSGARLFHRGPPWLSVAAVVEDPVPPLADPALDAIAQAALVKDPAQRIASAGELADRLRGL